MWIDGAKIRGNKKWMSALPALILICVIAGIGWLAAPKGEKERVTITPLSVEGIADKFRNEDGYYLTVGLEDWLVESCHLSYDSVSLKTGRSIYDQVAPGERSPGVTLRITVPENRPGGDLIRWVMKEERQDLCEIISVTRADNSLIDGT